MSDKIGKYSEDTLDKRFTELKSFSQQRSHIGHEAIPGNTEGIVGEVRFVDDGSTFKVIVKTSKGWKSAPLT
jgi:hypothetical protein